MEVVSEFQNLSGRCQDLFVAKIQLLVLLASFTYRMKSRRDEMFIDNGKRDEHELRSSTCAGGAPPNMKSWIIIKRLISHYLSDDQLH